MASAPALQANSVSPRKKTIRLFQGIAGSPLSVITDATSIPVQKPKRGRPRRHADNADRQASYRNRKMMAKLRHVMKGDENADSRGKYMTEAPHGKGLLITGGYDLQKIEQVNAARELAEDEKRNGRRVQRAGYGPDSTEHTLPEEKDSTFQFKRKFRIPKNWNLDDRGKEELIRDMVMQHIEPALENPDWWQCMECPVTFNFPSQAVNHFTECHHKMLQKEIRDSQPRKTRK
jgi:hypothetical protein